MKNIFEQMGKPTQEELQWEEVTESALSCQEKGCFEVVTEGKYSSPLKVLTWKCKNNHISKIEDFNLD